MKPKLSVIYDITKKCPWNCCICCMGASSGCDVMSTELPLDRKLSLMSDLEEVNAFRDVYIDFSGGEIFTNMENLRVVEKAASILGKEKVGISSSGYQMSPELAARLSNCISECEMTMDVVPGKEYILRPKGYAIAAAKAVPYLQQHNITVGIQTVLAHSNCTEETLRDIYEYLCNAGVEKWSILKFYPSGRGINYKHEVLSAQEEAWAVEYITNLDYKNTSTQKPIIDFHYTMKGHKKHSCECRCVRKSIGILPDGTVTSCFWAVDSSTGIIEPKYLLGSVRDNSLVEILNNDKSAYWMDCPHICELAVA